MTTFFTGRRICVTLIFLSQIIIKGNSYNTCYAVEDEHYVVKCNWRNHTHVQTILENNGDYITWYKHTHSNTKVNISAEVNSRIIAKGDTLEFWPLQLSDSGEYSCAIQNETSRPYILNVVMRSQDNCFSSSCIRSLHYNVGNYAKIPIDLPDEYTYDMKSIVWYKDCKWFAEGIPVILFHSVEHSNAGEYTFIITHSYNGQSYNASRRIKLFVENKEEILKPAISGDRNNTVTVELGNSYNTCYAVEDEHYVVKCNWRNHTHVQTILENNGDYITWYKHTHSNTKVNISAEVNSRIIAKGDTLEFWPLQLSDSGEYSCAIQNETSRPYILNVVMRSQDNCFSSSCIRSLHYNVGNYAKIPIDLPDEYTYDMKSIVWYKDCKWFAEGIPVILFHSVEHSNAGEYTFIITHSYNGQSYNASRRIKLFVENKEEILKPAISGDRNNTVTVELGQDLTVDCKAFYGYIEDLDVMLYWLQMNKNYSENSTEEEFKFVDICDSLNATCMTDTVYTDEENEYFVKTDLHIRNINEDDVNYPYKCQLVSNQGHEAKFVTLRIKERNGDISNNFFKIFMSASAILSVCIVFLVMSCIILRIELVLLYRSLTKKDDTIGDGKEYDAYLSFVNSSLDSEETEFALKTLPDIMENYFGYKLCIFERDVIPGGAMANEIISSLEKCRRLIILLSKNFMSGKAMYELESGLHKALVERKIKVILIVFTPLNELIIMPDSLQLLKASSRVKWEGAKSKVLKSRFWKKIQYLMPAKPFKPRI